MKKMTLILLGSFITFGLHAQNLADLFEAHKNSVVTIYVAEQVNTGAGDPRTFTSSMGLGSGVLIRENVILTAAHVVGNAEEIMVQFYDGQSIPATTERMSRVADVAIIRLKNPPKNPQIATLANSDSTRIGEGVFVIGAPMGLPFSLSTGVISGRHSENKMTTNGKQLEFFQTDAAINTGNSGGPMFNYKGEVVGIVSSILTRSGGFEGIGFAATTNICVNLLSVKSSKYFGIEAVPLTYEFAQILNVPQESGWLIQHVVKNSPAGKIGLKGGFRKVRIDEQEVLLGGDIVLALDGIAISGPQSLEEIQHHMDQVSLPHTFVAKVLRGGEVKEFRWITSDL